MSAVLENRFYYLDNFETVVHWVRERHGDLLNPEEHAFLHQFAALPYCSRALLVRLVMRKGELFRLGKLVYDEIGELVHALQPLADLGYVELDAAVSIHELTELLTRAELRAAFKQLELRTTQSKATWGQILIEQFGDVAPQTISAWWPSTSEEIVRLRVRAVCERLRLMFFGNMHQDWSEFVLADLGIKSFQKVNFCSESRAFNHRWEVDAYLHLELCREEFKQGHSPSELIRKVPLRPYSNPWVERRRSRLLFKIARDYERKAQWKQALKAYAASRHPEARTRQIRVLELAGLSSTARALAQSALIQAGNEAESQKISRMAARLDRTLGVAAKRRVRRPQLASFPMSLPQTTAPTRVELLVRDYLHEPAAPTHYVENTLINSLFGLLCWDAIFAALPGAFFHPFQSRPADLHHPDFLVRRRPWFDACLAQLRSNEYRRTIQNNFRRKAGLQCTFVAWESLNPELLRQALECIPARHLQLWFERMLSDLQNNCSGFPDLVQFWPVQRRYRLIEVKGPGDRLQDNQRRWLDYCQKHELPVSVCYVTWAS